MIFESISKGQSPKKICDCLDVSESVANRQAIGLLGFGSSILSAWGAAAGSELRIDAAAYLKVKALGAPATVLLLVIQVRSMLA